MYQNLFLATSLKNPLNANEGRTDQSLPLKNVFERKAEQDRKLHYKGHRNRCNATATHKLLEVSGPSFINTLLIMLQLPTPEVTELPTLITRRSIDPGHSRFMIPTIVSLEDIGFRDTRPHKI